MNEKWLRDFLEETKEGGEYDIRSTGGYTTKNFEIVPINSTPLLKEPNYESYEECYEFWLNYGPTKVYVSSISSREKTKTVIYNLCAVHKYLREMEFGGWYRGIDMNDAIYIITGAVSCDSPEMRIKSPEAFVNFAMEELAERYYSYENDSALTFAIVDTINKITKILNNEDTEKGNELRNEMSGCSDTTEDDNDLL